MTALDPALCARLVAEARSGYQHPVTYTDAMVTLRARVDQAREVADQLEAALADRQLIMRLEAALHEACDNLDPEWEVTARIRKLADG